MSTPADPRRLICRCIGISSTRILEEARSRGLSAVAEVAEATCAGNNCTTCQPEIEELLADLHGQPFDARDRLENRLICEAETASRIEGSVESAIVPKLAPLGVNVAEIEVDGLDVALHLDRAPDAETAAMIVRKLRKLVCADLVVKIFP